MTVFSKLEDLSATASEWGGLLKDRIDTIPVSVALAGGVITLGVIVYVVKRKGRKNLPPGPAGLPFLGAVHKLSSNMADDIDKLRDEYGDICSFYLMSDLWVAVAGYDLNKEAFVKQGDVFAARPFPELNEMVGLKDQILAAPYNETWKKNKKFAVTALRKIGIGTPRLEEKIMKEYNVFSSLIQKEAGHTINLEPALSKALCRIITCALFSGNGQETEEELQQIAQIARNIGDGGELGMLMAVFPVWLSKIVYRKGIKVFKDSTAMFRTIIEKHLEQHKMNFDPENPRDVLDIYMTRIGNDMTVEDVVQTLIMFLPDSIDTLSRMTLMCLLYITYYPEVQDCIHKELKGVIGSQGSVSLSDRQNLPYLQATILESFRFCNPTEQAIVHMADRETTLKGYTIPKGTLIMENMRSIHNDPQVFPQPEKFDPGHFLKDGVVVNSDHCLPFNQGRRMCPGETIVKTELFLFVSNLLYKYSLSFPEDQPKPSLDRKPVFGVFMIPEICKFCIQPKNINEM